MKMRLIELSLFLSLMIFTSAAVAGTTTEIGRVRLPELTSAEWAMLRQEQGANRQIVPIAVNLAVNHGVVYAVRIRQGQGSGYPEIDHAIVHWIETKWRTDLWFRGGDAYVVNLDIDPVLRHIVFRNNDGNVRRPIPSVEPLRADTSIIKVL
jgi:hypothetical protein